MTSPELNLRMIQARTDELRRRAATPRRTGSTSGTAATVVEAVPLTIRFAGPQDADRLTALAGLDSAVPLAPPVLVAEVEGELRAAMSMHDGTTISDPFHPTLEHLALLHTRAQQLSDRRARSGVGATLRTAVRMLRALRLEL